MCRRYVPEPLHLRIFLLSVQHRCGLRVRATTSQPRNILLSSGGRMLATTRPVHDWAIDEVQGFISVCIDEAFSAGILGVCITGRISTRLFS